MRYVDVGYYRDVFGGAFSGSDAELGRLLEAACVKVDELTFGRIGRVGFDGLTEFRQECVRKAVCYQADYYAKNGLEGGGLVSSYRALDLNVWYLRDERTRAEKARFSEIGFAYLEKSGLMSRVDGADFVSVGGTRTAGKPPACNGELCGCGQPCDGKACCDCGLDRPPNAGVIWRITPTTPISASFNVVGDLYAAVTHSGYDKFVIDTRGDNSRSFGAFENARDRVAFVSCAIPYDVDFKISGDVTIKEWGDNANEQTGVGFMVRNGVGHGDAAASSTFLLSGLHLGMASEIDSGGLLHNKRVGRWRWNAGQNSQRAPISAAMPNLNIELNKPFHVSLTRIDGNTFIAVSDGAPRTVQLNFTGDENGKIYVGMANSRGALAVFENVKLEVFDG